MTNELLAQLIGEGDNDELIPLLWEKTRKWFGTLAGSYARQCGDRMDKFGVTIEDLKHEGYFAMLDGIENYKRRTEEHKDEKFTNFCWFVYKERMQIMLGLKARKGSCKFDAHTRATHSLDSIIEFRSSKSSEDDKTIADETPDDAANERVEDEFDKVEAEDNRKLVGIILNKVLVGEKEREIIRRFYINNETLEAIAESWGWGLKKTRLLKDQAIKRLKNNRLIMEYGYECDAYTAVGYKAFVRAQCSVVERVVEKRESEAKRQKILDDLIAAYDSEDKAAFSYDENATYRPDYIWVYDESRYTVKNPRGPLKEVDRGRIVELIQKNNSISVPDICKALNTSLSAKQISHVINTLGYAKKTVKRATDDNSVKTRLWIYTPGTRKNLSSNRKYVLDAERIDSILKKDPSIKVKELKEQIGTEMSVVQLRQTLNNLGYICKYVNV